MRKGELEVRPCKCCGRRTFMHVGAPDIPCVFCQEQCTDDKPCTIAGASR